jgi:hypothetical protein
VEFFSKELTGKRVPQGIADQSVRPHRDFYLSGVYERMSFLTESFWAALG